MIVNFAVNKDFFLDELSMLLEDFENEEPIQYVYYLLNLIRN